MKQVNKQPKLNKCFKKLTNSQMKELKGGSKRIYVGNLPFGG